MIFLPGSITQAAGCPPLSNPIQLAAVLQSTSSSAGTPGAVRTSILFRKNGRSPISRWPMPMIRAIYRKRGCRNVCASDRRHRSRTASGARQGSSRTRGEPLVLSDVQVAPSSTQGQLLYALGDGQWDIPELRLLLEKIVPDQGVMEGYEVEHQFPTSGNARCC